jgi:hypothetical protein
LYTVVQHPCGPLLGCQNKITWSESDHDAMSRSNREASIHEIPEPLKGSIADFIINSYAV